MSGNHQRLHRQSRPGGPSQQAHTGRRICPWLSAAPRRDHPRYRCGRRPACRARPGPSTLAAVRDSRNRGGSTMSLLHALFRILIFPGVLFAVPAAWMVLWIERKAVALLQQRIGPPFGQPFFDFIKLLGKATPPRSGLEGALLRAWPLVAVSASIGAVGLLPVLPLRAGFSGDLILLL